MRYNVHSPCAFHNGIAKISRGPRRGRAGCDPGAAECRAQAQTPAAPTVVGDGRRHGHGHWRRRRRYRKVGGGAWWRCRTKMRWLLEYTEPDVAWDDAKADGDPEPRRHYDFQVISPRMTHGSITASGDFACPTTRRTADEMDEMMDGKVIGDGERLDGLPARSTDRRPDGLHRP